MCLVFVTFRNQNHNPYSLITLLRTISLECHLCLHHSRNNLVELTTKLNRHLRSRIRRLGHHGHPFRKTYMYCPPFELKQMTMRIFAFILHTMAPLGFLWIIRWLWWFFFKNTKKLAILLTFFIFIGVFPCICFAFVPKKPTISLHCLIFLTVSQFLVLSCLCWCLFSPKWTPSLVVLFLLVRLSRSPYQFC